MKMKLPSRYCRGLVIYFGNVGAFAICTGRANAWSARCIAMKQPSTVIATWAIHSSRVDGASNCCASAGSQTAKRKKPEMRMRRIGTLPSPAPAPAYITRMVAENQPKVVELGPLEEAEIGGGRWFPCPTLRCPDGRTEAHLRGGPDHWRQGSSHRPCSRRTVQRAMAYAGARGAPIVEKAPRYRVD